MPELTKPELVVEDLNRQLDQIQADMLQTKRNFRFMGELVARQNEMLAIAINGFSIIADEKTGCDWATRQMALAALKRISLIKLPNEKDFAVMVPAT